MKKITLFCLAALAAVTMMACGGGGETEEMTTTEAGIYTEGTYTAEAMGYGGKVTVTLTVDATSIVECEITHENETRYMGGREGIEDGTYRDQILAAQGGEIEGVTRASHTTRAVKEAYAAARDMAKIAE